jgi:hypothetical protein
VALLGLNRQGRNRPSFKALELDRLTGFFAIAVSTVFDSLQRSIDLGDQFALSVTSAQFDGAVGFRRGAIGKVGVVLALVLKMLERLLGFPQDVLPPIEQFQLEILPLPLVHEGLFLAGPVEFTIRPKVWRVGSAVPNRPFPCSTASAFEQLHLPYSRTLSRGGLYRTSMTATTKIVAPAPGVKISVFLSRSWRGLAQDRGNMSLSRRSRLT